MLEMALIICSHISYDAEHTQAAAATIWTTLSS